MELTDKDRSIIVDLINIAWQAGAVRGPQMANDVELLRAKILSKPEAPKDGPKPG